MFQYYVHGTVGCSKIAILLMIFDWLCIYSNITWKKISYMQIHIKKCGYHLWKSNFKVQDTTKSVEQKRCIMICLNVPNFLYIHKNHFLSEKIVKNLKLFDSLKKLHVFCILNNLKVIFCWFKESLEHLKYHSASFFLNTFCCILSFKIWLL